MGTQEWNKTWGFCQLSVPMFAFALQETPAGSERGGRTGTMQPAWGRVTMGTRGPGGARQTETRDFPSLIHLMMHIKVPAFPHSSGTGSGGTGRRGGPAGDPHGASLLTRGQRRRGALAAARCRHPTPGQRWAVTRLGENIPGAAKRVSAAPAWCYPQGASRPGTGRHEVPHVPPAGTHPDTCPGAHGWPSVTQAVTRGGVCKRDPGPAPSVGSCRDVAVTRSRCRVPVPTCGHAGGAAASGDSPVPAAAPLPARVWLCAAVRCGHISHPPGARGPPAAPAPRLPCQGLRGSAAPHRDIRAAGEPASPQPLVCAGAAAAGEAGSTRQLCVYLIFILRDLRAAGLSVRPGQLLPPGPRAPLPAARRCGSFPAWHPVLLWRSQPSFPGRTSTAEVTPHRRLAHRVASGFTAPDAPGRAGGSAGMPWGNLPPPPPRPLALARGVKALAQGCTAAVPGKGRPGWRGTTRLREAPPAAGTGGPRLWRWWDRPCDCQEENPSSRTGGQDVGEEDGRGFPGHAAAAGITSCRARVSGLGRAPRALSPRPKT